MTSASLDIWKDTGYTEGCLEVPLANKPLPTADFSFDGLEISTSSMFSEVKVRGAFEDLYDCSYLKIRFDMNNGSDVTVYGWIDSVAIGSDSAGSPMTRISWHVDLWGTYFCAADFGSGIVKRRPLKGDVPPQPYGPRYVTAKTPHQLFTDTTVYWVFINATQTIDGVSKTITLCYPVDTANFNENLPVGTTDLAPSFKQTIEGNYDELFAIDPDSIFSAFISPVPPAGASVVNDRWLLDGWELYSMGEGTEQTYGAFKPWFEGVAYKEQFFSTMAQTTDTTSYVLTDFDRNPVGALPWGISVSTGKYRIVNADVSMYLAIRFCSAVLSSEQSAANGLEFLIPLKTIGITANAKSSYVYSGQQELDRQQMAVQRDQAFQSGLVNIGNSAVQGAMSGALLGAIGGPGGAAFGAVVGAGSSMVGSAIGTIGDYAISGVANDRMLDATIRQKAQQTNGLMLPSSGIDWVIHGAMPMLIPLQWDDYSIAQRAQDIALYGAHVDEPMEDCTSIIRSGGPMQIANLTVLGSIPVQAKRYIKERLSNGVRIV